MARVHWGNAIADGRQHAGWFIGKFISTNLMCQSEAVEVKFSQHKDPYCEEGSTANQTATSMSLNISGTYEYLFREQEQDEWELVTLSERGQYVIWLPGVFHSLRVDNNCEMVVVRWPSAGRSDKINGPNPWRKDQN